MYNGMSGVVEKAGDALSVGVVGVLFDAFGNSTASRSGCACSASARRRA